MKNIDDLAIFGARPLFTEHLHVGRPNIGNREAFLSRVNDILDRKWLTNNGLYVRKFEQLLADFVGVKHCIAITNGTVALELAIRALALTGEVIVPSFTFVATAHALQWQEITPVFCDIDPDTHNLDANKVEEMITPRTTGIIGVHVWGRPSPINELTEIARKHNLKLLFDAAHAFGSSYQGQMIGNFGDAEIYSFHATKFFNTFEGGAIATNNDQLAAKIRLMKNFGFAGKDKVIYIGINGKMSEVSAAMGITGLEEIEHTIAINRKHYHHYQRKLSGIDGVKMINYNEEEKCNYQYIVLEIDDDVTSLSRDDLVKILHAERILARRYFYPGVHHMEPYKSHFPHAGLLLPETEKLTQRVVSLPTGSSVTDEDIDKITDLIRYATTHGEEISYRLHLLTQAEQTRYS